MDLSAILLFTCAAAGAIVLAETLYLKPRRLAVASGNSIPEPLVVNYARSFFPVILIVLVVRSFLFEPFRIPSPSMMPNLVDGDFVFVTKYVYGLRLPFFNTKVLSTGEPQRGDVVVFRLPSDPSVHYIKRLIGLPGDHVLVRNNRLTINGSEIPLAPDGRYSGGYGFAGSPLGVERFGKQEHEVMFAAGRSSTDFDTIVTRGALFLHGRQSQP